MRKIREDTFMLSYIAESNYKDFQDFLYSHYYEHEGVEKILTHFINYKVTKADGKFITIKTWIEGDE